MAKAATATGSKVRPRATATSSASVRRRAARPFTLPHFERWASGVILDNGEPWSLEEFQREFLRDLFRGFKECWWILPEGNTKTTSLAGVAIYHIQHRRRALAGWAASSRDQAQWGYLQADAMVRDSDALRPHFKCLEGYRRIRCDSMGSRLQIFAADDRTGDGIIPTLALLDELHRHKNLRLYRTWHGKLGKKEGAQIATISTAGEPGAEFEETRDRIRSSAIRMKQNGSFLRVESPGRVLMHEWAVPKGADVEDMAVVKAANPFSGITIESLTEKRASPTSTLAHWLRFTCNQAARGEASAITEAEWEAARVRKGLPKGEPVWLGLDVAWKWDTTAMVPLWMQHEEFRLLGPATILEPPRDGTSLDPHLVEDALFEIHDRNPIHTVVMDTNKAEQLAEWIREELGAEVVDRSQTNAFATMDYERFMEALRIGWLKHTGDPGLTAHVLNAVARQLPGGDTRFERPHQSRHGAEQDRRVIDALTAAAMVHTSASAPTEEFVWGAV